MSSTGFVRSTALWKGAGGVGGVAFDVGMNESEKDPAENLGTDPATGAHAAPVDGGGHFDDPPPAPNLLNSQGCRQTAADKESWHIL